MANKTILIGGYGPGISSAVARKFGGEGWQVALVGRTETRLEEGVRALAKDGITAKAFPCDLGDPKAVQQLIGRVRDGLGPITVIHWNAYAGLAGDLTSCDLDELRTVLDIGVVGAVAAVQAALPDLREQDGAAVLITGGGFAYYADEVDNVIAQYGAMGLGVAKAAQHKLTGVLHHKLAADGIYVGSIVVLGAVAGTAFDRGGDSLDPDEIGEAFWTLYSDRSDVSRRFPA